jgi:6-phosphogluconate dehydrogenase
MSLRPAECDIAVAGLGVMGRSLALNIADRGFMVAVYNRTASVTHDLVASLGAGQRVRGCLTVEELVAALQRPRKVLLMVSAGAAVDALVDELEPLLEPGDVVIDGGNSFFKDSERRAARLGPRGVRFLGLGVSGGEYGARHGPSLMAGGPSEGYEAVRPVLEAIAARVEGKPCAARLGPGGAGHYVKMVHNGIEYGLMQLIAESYALLKWGLGFSNERMADTYSQWAEAELGSYLVEITSEIFRRADDRTGGRLIDAIQGEAGQKGTGMWASQSAMDLHVPVPNIDIAVSMRDLSALDAERGAVRGVRPRPQPPAQAALSAWAGSATGSGAAGLDAGHVRAALYAATILTYAQGFALLRAASSGLGYGIASAEVAAVWRGGCIIRSVLLADLLAAFRRQADLVHVLADPMLAEAVTSRRADLAATVQAGAAAAIPVPGLAAALSYLDAYQAEWLPFNLIQAQRDYFGAHTYRRVDVEGAFHTDWLSPEAGS